MYKEYDLTIYIPTRGRPEKIYGYETNFYLKTELNTRCVFILSEDDPKLNEYLKLPYIGDKPIVVRPEKRGFVNPLNLGYKIDSARNASFAVGFMGDDHIARSEGWDKSFVDELVNLKSGFVYGDDGFQHEAIPTHIAMTSDIPQTLGYMTYPMLWHLFADNFWLDLGRSLGKITYLPEVFIEHMHPAAGKTNSDPGYEFSGAYSLHTHDEATYTRYLVDQLPIDNDKLTSMMKRTGKL